MRKATGLCLLFLACGETKPPPPPTVRTTYRIISGVSMGATGAAALGFANPERFDGVAVLGGPLDATYFMRMIDRFQTGGFCTLSELEAILASDPVKLNDPAALGCMHREPALKWEHSQDFNHWHYTMNGTSAMRDTYMDMFTDITLAYGNLATHNAMSPFAPTGVPADRMRNPPADFCTNPLRIKSLYNLEYNPLGKYDAITFCDGQPRLFFCRNTMERVDFCSDPQNKVTPLPVAQEVAFAENFCMGKGGAQEANKRDHPLFMLNNAGEVDPCRQPVRPLTFAVAYDLNGNGRRDYGEPLVKNSRERFDDVGTDGCADAFENGQGGCNPTAAAGAVDPNHDNYDPDLNPLGAELDWAREEGEAYRDDGLDGVPGTSDFGEGNGRYDVSPGVAKFLAHDGRTNFKKLDPAGRARLNVLVDGGIRDVFNLGVMAKHLFASVKALRTGAVGEYRDFIDIPGMKDHRTGMYTYNPWNNRWGTVPRDIEVLYGKESPTDQDRIEGEGDHVGTPGQAVNRFNTMFNWAAATWPHLARPSTPLGGSSVSERQRVEVLESTKLGAKWEYGLTLPPGYDAPENADVRYPVLIMMHGYGMNAKDFMGTSLITDTYVTDTDVKFRPMIMIFPNGRCCYRNAAGAKDCRETDETGTELGDLPGWERECESGSFYVNRSGYAVGDETPYGDALLELVDHVDATYRTMKPADVPER